MVIVKICKQLPDWLGQLPKSTSTGSLVISMMTNLLITKLELSHIKKYCAVKRHYALKTKKCDNLIVNYEHEQKFV